MKKLAYISGAFFTSTTILGELFRLMHWELGPLTGGLLLAFGLFGIALIFIPSFAFYQYGKEIQ